MKTKKKNTDLRKIWKSSLKTIKTVKGKEQKKQLLAFVLDKFAEITTFAEGIKSADGLSALPEPAHEPEPVLPEVAPSAALLNDLQHNHLIQPENETKTS